MRKSLLNYYLILKSKHRASKLSFLKIIAVQYVLESHCLFPKAPLYQVFKHVPELPLSDKHYSAVLDGLAALVGAKLSFLHSAVFLGAVINVFKNKLFSYCTPSHTVVFCLAALVLQHSLAPQYYSNILYWEIFFVDKLIGLVSCDCSYLQQAFAYDSIQFLEKRVALLQKLLEPSHFLLAQLLVLDLQVVVDFNFLQDDADLLLIKHQRRGVSFGNVILYELVICQLRVNFIFKGQASLVD